MEFDIDVSGKDLLSKDYTICIANKDSLIRGFKLNEELVNILSSKYGQELYQYKKSNKAFGIERPSSYTRLRSG